MVLGLPMLAIAAAIRVTSRGPALHRYEMVGKGGRIFRGQKFRTMVTDAHQMRDALMHRNEMTGPVFKLRDDPRVTPIGRWLRKYSVDELPQLFSVLSGDMSLVGPRPPGPYEWEKFEPWQRQKLLVTPGMTSLWIVRGKPQDFDRWIRLDIAYINRWSLWLDLQILWQTLRFVLHGQNH